MTVTQFRRFLNNNNLRADYLGDNKIVYDKTYFLVGKFSGETVGSFYVECYGWTMIHAQMF